MKKMNVSNVWKVLFVMVVMLGAFSSVNAQRYQQVKIVDRNGEVQPPNPSFADMVLNFTFSGDYISCRYRGVDKTFKWKYQRTDGNNDVYFIEATDIRTGNHSYNDKNVIVVSSGRKIINMLTYNNAYQLNYKIVYERNDGIRYD